MIDNQFFDELAKQFTSMMPESLQQFKNEMEKNIRAVMQNAFSKMNLVTREEFDVQANVLKKARMKIDELEKKLAELEMKTNKPSKKN